MRLPFSLLLAVVIAAPAGACHRRRPRDGTCVVHLDCAPGYDCVARRCAKRAAAPGTAGVAPGAPAESPEPSPSSPTSPWGEEPAAPEGSPQPANRPRPKAAPPAPLDNVPAPPPSDLPAWKARLKNNI